MDPISALGAVSSAIGIAGFALDLSVGLFTLASQFRSAKDSLKGVGETVRSIAYALEEVEQLLRKEEHHVQQGGTLQMFSTKGLARVKETTDQCLIVLWKVEAIVVGCEEPEEPELAARLATRASASVQEAITLDRRFTNPSPSVWNRLVFAVSASDKLQKYGAQLQNFQISLGLILNVVTVTYLLTKRQVIEFSCCNLGVLKMLTRSAVLLRTMIERPLQRSRKNFIGLGHIIAKQPKLCCTVSILWIMK